VRPYLKNKLKAQDRWGGSGCRVLAKCEEKEKGVREEKKCPNRVTTPVMV
jgi:hypothetical protein